MNALILLCGCLLGPLAQEPDGGQAALPTTAELDASFAVLPDDRKELVLRVLERHVMLDPDPTIQRIVSMSRGWRSYPEATPRSYHDPERWAPVAPPRTLIQPDSDAHRAVREAMPPIRFLRDLHQEVYYDWGTGQAVRRAEPLSSDERFHNVAAGYPPGADQAAARIQAMLDGDRRQRKLAAYFEHLYADLQARAYAGVTLYEAWYSTQELAMPDVDAIPFAREILGTRSYRSPIPANSRREKLYQKIRDAAVEHRKYRTLREAAAAAFVRAEPIMDPVYALMIPRFHYLYATLEDDPARLAELLRKTPDRQALLEAVDSKIRVRSADWEIRESAAARLEAMAERLCVLAARALARAQ